MAKVLLILILFISLIGIIPADDQFVQICGGDNELQVLCLGDAENSPAGFLPVVTSPIGGAGGGPAPEIPEDLISLIESKPTDWGLWILIILIILLSFWWFFIVWKRRKKKKKEIGEKEK
ncbi:MAG: hypothetical protein WC758_07905 [Candidatus Woesearchaeota archaeon]